MSDFYLTLLKHVAKLEHAATAPVKISNNSTYF